MLLLQFMAEFPEPDCDIFIDVSATKEICGELVQLITFGIRLVLLNPDAQMFI